MYTILIKAYLTAHVVHMPGQWKIEKSNTMLVYRNDLHYLYNDKEAKETARAAVNYYKTVAVLHGQHVERYEIIVLDGPYINDTKLSYIVHPVQSHVTHSLQEIFEPTPEQIESRRLNKLVNKAIATYSNYCGHDLNNK
jgi:hypothetical protein